MGIGQQHELKSEKLITKQLRKTIELIFKNWKNKITFYKRLKSHIYI